MKVVTSPAAARRELQGGMGKVVLVPTMGALHAGHRALLDKGRKLAGKSGVLVASIFVNPIQFGPKEDLARYPRPLAEDKDVCAKAGVDLVFHPTVEAMYAADFSMHVEESALSTGLCGPSRPGHFRGVCTVVLKLFNIIQPDIAVFGEKDYQQLAVIRRMVRDLDLPIQIVGVTTVREPDGLALSSRNRYLTPEQRADAFLLRKGLEKGAAAIRAGGVTAGRVRKIVESEILKSSHARIDYIEVADATTLEPLKKPRQRVVIAAAVFFGSTRLIDNIVIP